jgi:hypothetical protein
MGPLKVHLHFLTCCCLVLLLQLQLQHFGGDASAQLSLGGDTTQDGSDELERILQPVDPIALARCPHCYNAVNWKVYPTWSNGSPLWGYFFLEKCTGRNRTA